jgi:hypothetical protein
MTEVEHPDVAAMLDVIDDMVEQTDSLGVEDGIKMREAIVELRRRANVLLGLIDTQLISILESPREVNGVRYEVRKSDGKWRPDHSKVVPVVRTNAMVDLETGEIHEGASAVERAISIMEDLYVSPSTMPKVGALEKIGLKKWDVADQEPGKPTLKTTAVVPEPS